METIEENQVWNELVKKDKARKAIVEFLEYNGGVLYNNLEKIIKVKNGRRIRKIPVYQALREVMLDGNIVSLNAIRTFINENKEEYKKVNALHIINELISIDNMLYSGENNNRFQQFLRQCENRSLKDQVILTEPYSEVLNEAKSTKKSTNLHF